jgi:hypothetical protein
MILTGNNKPRPAVGGSSTTIVRLVNTKAHAIIDYCLSLLLVFSPWLFEFSPNGVPAKVAYLCAAFTCTFALITRFEFSICKFIPLKLHMRLDFLLGLFLAVSPVLFDFQVTVFKPHLVFGLTLMVIAAITDRILYRRFKAFQENNFDQKNNAAG